MTVFQNIFGVAWRLADGVCRGWAVWHDLGKAFCLVLVIEGLMPFIAPSRWRNLARLLSEVDDRTMRIIGLASMLLGAGLLFFFR